MAWYNESWTKRVKVTIDHTKVGATLSDFPVYIDLSELPADFHTNCNQTDARDIRVTTSDEVTEVPREVVFYDSTTDTGELHFKAPSLSSSADTDFYIYYGNTSATEPAVDATYGRNNVWAGVYKSVLHLNESSGNPIESSGKVSATFSGSLPDAQAGQIGNGQDFDGDGDYVELANDSDLDCTNQSLSFWLKADSFSTHKSFYARRTSNTDGEMLFYYTTTSSINWDTAGSGKRWNTGYTPPIDGTKILIHLTFDGSVKRLYVNGSLNANTASDIHSLLNANTVGRIGSDTQSSQYHVDGLMDEFRLSGETLSADWISTEYNNQSAPNTFYTTGVAESMPVGDWYNASWGYRVKITVQSSQVDATLTDFPVYVDLSGLPAGFHTNVNQTDGRDIRVTKADGLTELPREVVFYDSATDTGELHFKADSLSSSANTEFFIYYGNTSATEPATSATYGAQNVWDSSFKAVYHLQQTPTAVQVDSTANGKNSTSYTGSMDSNDSVSAILGKGLDFDGGDDDVTVSDTTNYFQTTNLTVSCWINTAGFTESGTWGIVSSGTTGTAGSWALGILSPSQAPVGHFEGSDNVAYNANGTTDVVDGTYHFIYMINDGSNNKVYVDGAEEGTISTSGKTVKTGAWGLELGGWNTTTRSYKGIMDEVRISSTARSTDWMLAEYTNQATPTTFYTVGTQEEPSASGTDANVERSIYTAGKENNSVFRGLYVVGKSASSITRNIYVSGRISGSLSISTYVLGKSTDSIERGVHASGSHILSTDYFDVEFAPTSAEGSVERGIYVIGSLASSVERGIYTAGKNTSSISRGIYVISKADGSVSRGIYIVGKESSSIVRGLHTTGKYQGEISRSLYVIGKEVEVERDIYVIGKDSSSITRGIYTEGKAVGSLTRSLYAIGRTVTSLEKSIYVLGSLQGSVERNLYVEGAGVIVERGIYVIGKNSSSLERNIHVIGTADSSIERGIFVIGKESGEVIRNIHTIGQVTVSVERNIHTTGSLSSEVERNIYTKGEDSGSIERSIFVMGIDSSVLIRSIYVIGKEESHTERNIHTQGKDTGYVSRSIYVVGSLSNSISRGIYVKGNNISTISRSIFIIGKSSSIIRRNIYVIGKVITSIVRGIYVAGKKTGLVERGIYVDAIRRGCISRGFYVIGRKGFWYRGDEKDWNDIENIGWNESTERTWKRGVYEKWYNNSENPYKVGTMKPKS